MVSSRNELPRHFKSLGLKAGVEVGVYAGVFTEKFCKEGLKMYGVDPWLGYSGMGRTFQKQETMDRLFKTARERLSKYKNVSLFKETSMEAIKRFQDNSIGFVYIDGDHDFSHIAEDLYEWYKKVRPGGIISGHDYIASSPRATNVVIHVKPVIDAFVRYFKIDDFQVVGQGVDNIPSWMFTKK